MAQPSIARVAAVRSIGWPQRYTVVGLFFLGTALCYIDRISISVAIIPLAREFGYDSAAKGLVLSAVFWGYIWTQLLGGWMADRFGGHRVLAAGVAIWSLATFVTPIAAAATFPALLAARVLLGLGEGVNFPSIHSLTSRWTLPAERARALSFNYSGMYVGTVLALSASPLIIGWLGWPALFYISGALGGVWVAFWMIFASDRPENSKRISPDELELITSSRTAEPLAINVPWAAIAREKAVWAIVVAHFCSNFGYNILLLWMPTYLNHTFHVPLARVGVYSIIPWIATFFTVSAAGWLSDLLIARGVEVGSVRKSMQAAAFAIGAIPLCLVPFAWSPATAVALLTVAASANGISSAAFGVNHLDVAPTYAGILMGISNTVATIPGIIGVAATGLIVQATKSFSAVFYLIAAVYCAGMFFYLRWASGEQRL
ncbi:MAG: ACS family MFS transporter [Candidatus Binatus sp.]|uniref:ACS family MFS transporter n=1 Tax=Candidatus Binatus sp. TaxID=2811406 RepID=UPI0027186A6B|nr:ACS family MFS transporter [Candidatus Binatus sp.]MDO8433375.1 ACS family MFS transporter [Candidatus Binatus sp.]